MIWVFTYRLFLGVLFVLGTFGYISIWRDFYDALSIVHNGIHGPYWLAMLTLTMAFIALWIVGAKTIVEIW